jgi:ABC-2 type transport system ATP-binding protein
MTAEPSCAIRAKGLTKRYSEKLAVDGFELEIQRGEFYGLLGPNGAGKTTAIHMLSTLIRPTQGEAWVAGYSVRAAPVKVRGAIGVVFQESALDRNLTVEENLRFAGLLNHMPHRLIASRSEELLQLFGLAEKRAMPVATLSGGMRRALDIARGVMHHPQILFLDEPTIGLDLPNRRNIWRHIARLRAELGITVFLTTHYLEEALDCDRVGFISAGRIVSEGLPRQLVAGLGDYIIEIEAAQPELLAQALQPRLGSAIVEGSVISFRFDGDAPALAQLNIDLAPQVRALRWRRPNLNDVFLWVMHGAKDGAGRGNAAIGAARPGVTTT